MTTAPVVDLDLAGRTALVTGAGSGIGRQRAARPGRRAGQHDDKFALIQRVLVKAPYRLVKLVLPYMYRRGWGRIVNISSVHGLLASPFKAAYVTARHGLDGLSKVTALAVRRSPSTAAGRRRRISRRAPGHGPA